MVQSLQFSTREFQWLEYLVRHSWQVRSRDQIVKAHGGCLTLSSQVDQGSLFQILPIVLQK